MASADALHALADIETARNDADAALTLFRDEVRSREEILSQRPYDPDAKIALADAFGSIAQSLDINQPAQRSVALYHLERAVSLLGELPPERKKDTIIQDKMLAFHDRISKVLEMEE